MKGQSQISRYPKLEVGHRTVSDCHHLVTDSFLRKGLTSRTLISLCSEEVVAETQVAQFTR